MQPTKSGSSPQLQEWAYARKGSPQYWVWLALTLIGIYFAWFFLQSIDGGIRRLDRFILLLLPTELLNLTIGNGAEHLHVGVIDRCIPLGLTALWLAVSWWIGRAGIQLLAGELSWLESTGMCCLFGLSLLSSTTLLLGLAGWLNRAALVLVVVALCLVSFQLQRLFGSSAKHSVARSIPHEQLHLGQAAVWMWRLVPVGVGLLVAMYVAGGWMPPFEFDAVEYHMQAPKEFYQQGKINFVDHNVYANMPLGIEMHSLAAMVLIGGQDGWWLGGITGNCIICMFSLLAAALASGYAARYFGRSAGWATAAILLSAPGNILVSGSGLVDSAIGAYLLATVICLQVWREKRTPLTTEAGATPASPVLACFFAGTAAGCKYTGLVFATIPTLLYISLVAYPQLRRWSAIKLVLFATLVCLATFTPWVAKNTFWASNPVYPLAFQLFGPGNLTESQVARWNKAHQVPKSSNGSAYDFPALKASVLSLAGKSEFLPAMLIPLVCIGLYVSSSNFFRHPATPPLMLGVWIVLVWWLATHRIERFWLPALPLFSIATAAGTRWLLIRSQSAIVALCLLLTLIYAGLVSITGAYTDNRWFVSYDSLRRDVGTDETPGRVPKTIGWINLNLPVDSRILSVGEARAFLFERPLLYATCFNTPPGESALKNASAQQQLNWLAQNDITHLLIQWNEIGRYRSPGNYGFSNWPQTQDIEAMIDSGVVRRVAEWPFESQSAELLEVNRSQLP